MAQRPKPRTRWIILLAVVLPLATLWSCTTEPMTAVSDFQYEFPDFEIPPDEELDTTTVEIDDITVDEDTAYFSQQTTFTSDVTAAVQNNQRPQSAVDAAQATADALNDEQEDELAAIEEQAEDDPDAVIESISNALDDPNSAQSQLAQNVQNAAAQQATLASLLGLSAPSGKVDSGISFSKAPAPWVEESYDIRGSLGIEACSDDAQAAFNAAIAIITTRRNRDLAQATATFNASIAKIAAFVDSERAIGVVNRTRRRQQAQDVFFTYRAAITAFVNAGLITPAEERQFRVMNMMILMVNLRKAALKFQERMAKANAEASIATQTAINKRDSQQAAINASFTTTQAGYQADLQTALNTCHDQGQTTG